MNKTALTLLFSGIFTLLFSQSSNIFLKGQWDGAGTNYNDVWGYVDASGNEYAIIGSRTKIHFINVTNPSEPRLVKEFTGGNSTTWRDFKTFRHFAYGISDGNTQEGLLIFDLCDITNGQVELTNQMTSVFQKAHNIFIDAKNARLYVVGTNTRSQGVFVFDLSADPATPSLIGQVNLTGGYVHDIFVKDNIAYCSHGNNGLYIYDFSNPAAPVTQAFSVTGGYNHSSWLLDGDTLLIYAEEVPTGLPLGIMDVEKRLDNDIEILTTFKAPLLGPTHTNNTPHNPYVVGKYAIVSYYEDGLVIFDLDNPANPVRVGYYDTFSANSSYNGYAGCWGAYPFLPSGNILASDISNGLFILEPSFSLTNNCSNGIQDWNEEKSDCGGVCKACTPCVQEICDNGLDDDRNGFTDCLDEACDCPGSDTRIYISVMLEGMYDPHTDKMISNLIADSLLPRFQPFKLPPYFYAGSEYIDQNTSDMIDWVLVEARSATNPDSVLARKAAILYENGTIGEASGTPGIVFGEFSTTQIYLVIHHKSHLGVISDSPLSLNGGTASYDFTITPSRAAGTNQQKLVGNRAVLFAGDFDQNGIINNLDFNLWNQNSALINLYLNWDADGNGIINNQDFNLWINNRSKVGEPTVTLGHSQ